MVTSDSDGTSDGSPKRNRKTTPNLKRKRGKESNTIQQRTKRVRKPTSEIVSSDDDNDNSPIVPSTVTATRKKTNNNRRDSTSTRKNDKDGGGDDLDPARKYCLGKLREVLVPIFVQFTRPDAVEEPKPKPESVPRAAEAGEGDNNEEAKEATPAAPGLDEEEKKKVEQMAVEYTQELERCLYEIYGELDRMGNKTVGTKYKYVLSLTAGGHNLTVLYFF